MRILSWRTVQYGAIATLAFYICGCSEIEQGENARRVVAYMLEADRQLTLGHPTQARYWMDHGIALAPNSPQTYYGDEQSNGGLIHVLTVHDDWPDTVTYIGKAVANPKLPTNANLWSLLAQAQDHLGQEAAAKASYRHQLDILNGVGAKPGTVVASEDPVQLKIDKATAEWGAGMQDQSVADFQTVIATKPGSDQAVIAQNALAYMEADANTRLAQAFALAANTVAQARAKGADDGSLGEFIDTLAWVEYRMHKYDDAARDQEEAIGDLPTEAILHYHLARIYQASGDMQDARIEIDRSITMSPSDVDTQEAVREIEPGGQPVKS